MKKKIIMKKLKKKKRYGAEGGWLQPIIGHDTAICIMTQRAWRAEKVGCNTGKCIARLCSWLGLYCNRKKNCIAIGVQCAEERGSFG